MSCPGAGLLEENGREVAIGPVARSGLRATRKVFVPPSGGFARYLEILTNPTTQAITVPVEMEGYLGSDDRTRVVVAPSETNNTFAVTDQQGECCDPALAHVFGGPNAAVALTSSQFVNGNSVIRYRWQVTVPPGATVILMHFAVQREVLDTAGAQAQAQALVSLTDPNALVGMSADEKAAVVNFVVP